MGKLASALPDKGVRYTRTTGEVVNALPTCEKFHRDTSRMRLIMGPFGSGKSVGMCQEIFRRASRQKPNREGIRKSRFAVIRNTYPQLKDTTIKTWLDWFPEAQYGRFLHAPPMEHKMSWEVEDKAGGVTRVECEVLFRALDKPPQIKNLLSLELTGAWINEAREIPKAIFEAVDGRIGRYPAKMDGGCDYPFIILDTNPYDTDHWLYDLFEAQRLPGYKFWHQPGHENEPNLPKDYYANMSIGKDPEWVKMYVHGQHGFICDGKVVYPEFLHATHVSPEVLQPLRGVPISVGLDFGLTPAAVYTQISPTGVWLILRELVSDDMGIDRFGDRMIEFQNLMFPDHQPKDFRYYADPAGTQRAQTDEKTCYQILASKGMTCEPGAVDYFSRREAVAKPLSNMIGGKPAALIDGLHCKNIVKGFMGGYYYREIGNTGRYSELPEKNLYSHPHDALQYVATRLFSFLKKRKRNKNYKKPSAWTV